MIVLLAKLMKLWQNSKKGSIKVQYIINKNAILYFILRNLRIFIIFARSLIVFDRMQ